MKLIKKSPFKMKYQSPLKDNGDDKVVNSAGDDTELNEFLSGIHTIDNPEYASSTRTVNPDTKLYGNKNFQSGGLWIEPAMGGESEPKRSIEHDYFIKNRNERSDSTARALMDYSKQVKALRGERKFKEARAIQPKINELLEFVKTESKNYSASDYLKDRMGL